MRGPCCAGEGDPTRPRDLAHGERGLELVWRKRRWYCREPLCPTTSFTEQVRQVPARAWITRRLHAAAGRRVCDAGSKVIQAARDLHLSWPTVMEAFRTAGTEVTTAALEPVEVLGIDETRRGRTQWRHDPDTHRWERLADQWHTGFVDAFGVQGLLGQVEGRAPSDVLAWLTTTPLQWRKQIRYVAIDMSASYRAAVRTGLPHATVVVDHFHVVQLADKMLDLVRRRTTARLRGRRGRATDPEWKARRRLLRNRSDLSFHELARRINPVVAGWINYYGRYRPWELDGFLMRINAYLVRWIRQKYKRLAAKRKAIAKMQEIAKRYPRMFAHWRLTTSAVLV